MTAEELLEAVGCTAERAERFAGPISITFERYDIDTPARQAAFLAQVSHESGRFKWLRELWGPTHPQMRYSGRADLGNTRPEARAFAGGEDVGKFYRGRGLIQVTGYTNYARMAARLEIPCAEYPDMLADPMYAAMSAGDFWDDHGLNELADAGQFEALTRRINGGLNGLIDRLVAWDQAKRTLDVA